MFFRAVFSKSRIARTGFSVCLLMIALEGRAEPGLILELLARSQSHDFVPSQTPYKKLEADLQKYGRSRLPVSQYKSLGLEIAKIHINAQNYQLAMWALDRTGFHSEAKLIEDFLKETLVKGSFRDVNGMRKKQGPYGMEVFEKDESSGGRHLNKHDGAVNEAFAYELDRFIHLNRVPLNVQSDHHTRSLYVRDANDSGISFNYEGYTIHKKGPGIPQAEAEIYVFDYLTGATDRHERNSLVIDGYGNRLILIDNADMVWSMKDNVRPIMETGLPPEPEEMEKKIWKNARGLLDRIYAIDRDSFHEKFDPMIGSKRTAILISRIETLRKNDPQAAARSCGRVFSR